MFLILFPFAAAALAPAAALAQDSAAASRGRVAGTLGAGRTWDDEGSLGRGVAVGGRVEWRLFGITAIEGALDVLTHDRPGAFFASDGTSTILSASLVHRFGAERPVQGYVLEGLSFVRHTGTTRFEDRVTALSSFDPAFHFGGGLAVRIGERIEAGPEARFYLVRVGNDSDPAWATWIGARVGIRF
jgi:hypothetical protein